MSPSSATISERRSSTSSPETTCGACESSTKIESVRGVSARSTAEPLRLPWNPLPLASEARSLNITQAPLSPNSVFPLPLKKSSPTRQPLPSGSPIPAVAGALPRSGPRRQLQSTQSLPLQSCPRARYSRHEDALPVRSAGSYPGRQKSGHRSQDCPARSATQPDCRSSPQSQPNAFAHQRPPRARPQDSAHDSISKTPLPLTAT